MYKETLQKYLEDLASRKPAPGGGSAAALSAACAVALISMVANFTGGKEKYKSVQEQMKSILSSAERLRERLISLVDEDATAYQKLSQAFNLPKISVEDKRRRKHAKEEALKEAVAIPLEVCKCSHQAIKLCPVLAQKGNPNLISDTGVAALFLESAFQAALLNVEINLKSIQDEQFILQIREILEPLEKEMQVIKEQVTQIVKKHLAN